MEIYLVVLWIIFIISFTTFYIRKEMKEFEEMDNYFTNLCIFYSKYMEAIHRWNYYKFISEFLTKRKRWCNARKEI